MYHVIAILAQLVEQGISNAQVVGSSPIDGINSPEVNFKIMAYKSTGTAGKSASGASMSKYDVEVEGRLKALEAQAGSIPNIEGMINSLVSQVSELQGQVSQLQASQAQQGGGGEVDDATCAKVEQYLKDHGAI